MIDEELLNKFDRIQDLPVSEEMLGAYLESKLDFDEKVQVEDYINDSLDSEFIDSIMSEGPGYDTTVDYADLFTIDETEILDSGDNEFDNSYFFDSIDIPDFSEIELTQESTDFDSGFFHEDNLLGDIDF